MPASLHCNYPITMLQWHTHSCQFQCHCLWNVDTVVAMLSIATDAALDKANVEVAASKKVQWGTYRYLVSVELEIFTCTHSPYRQGCMDSGKA